MHIALLAALVGEFKIGDIRRISQFIYGFQTVGKLSREFAYKETGKDSGPLRGAEEIFFGPKGRFRDRPCNSDTETSSGIREEALEQRDFGRLNGPHTFNEGGTLRGMESSANNVASRLAVLQPGEVRAAGECRRAKIGDFCQVDTPIALPSWDHVAEYARRVAIAKVDWGICSSRSTGGLQTRTANAETYKAV